MALGLALGCSSLSRRGGEGGSSEIPERREFPVDRSISPCADFYGHACSIARSRFKLREDRSRHIFSFSDSAERLLEKKKAFLAKLESESSLSARGEQLKDFYSSCMNVTARAMEEKKFVARITREVLHSKERQAFLKWVESKLLSPDGGIFSYYPLPNLDDPEVYDVFIDSNWMGLPERSYYSKPEVISDYLALQEEFFKTIGADAPAERARQSVDLEKRLAQKVLLPAEFREKLNVKSRISKSALRSSYSSVGLEPLLSEIPDTTVIRNPNPEQYEFLEHALAKESLQALQSIALFAALNDVMDEGYPEFQAKLFEFKRKHLGGPEKRPELKERCVKSLESYFLKELDAELLPRIFPHFPQEKFVKLAEKVRAAIVDGLRENKWLSAVGKKAAIEKIQTARLQLVKPLNDKEWDFLPIQKYSSEQYLENKRKLKVVLDQKFFKDLREKRDPNRWSMSPLTVNAYYSPSDNKFVMPIGILQYPFYDPALPDEVNLGAVGAVIGHELGHGIDDKGARYDSRGRLKQWMSESDLRAFKTRSKRLVDQFNAIGHNGELTLGENIGDLVGVSFAYRAAFQGKNPTAYDKQAFFLQYARLWCGEVRPKMREQLIKVDPHAAIEARVNQQVKHQEAFSEAFGCEKGDPMTLPEVERVVIW